MAGQPFRETHDPSRFPLFETDRWSGWVKVMKPTIKIKRDANGVNWIKRERPHPGFRLSSFKRTNIPSKICGIYEIKATRSGRQPYVVYIGSTCTENKLRGRLTQYCLNGSQIDDALDKGYTLSMRYLQTNDKSAAKERENEYLHTFNYAWNVRINVPARYDVLP